MKTGSRAVDSVEDHTVVEIRTVGFRLTDNPRPEDGVEKVALFVKNEEVQHAARQLPDGRWTSKLGDGEDIAHNEVGAVEGQHYGQCQVFMARGVGVPEELEG